MKNAYFFGDSFTFGEGCHNGFEYYDSVEYDDKRIWPTILSETLNVKEVNHAKRGASSPEILRLILEYSPIFKKGDYVIFSDSLPNRIISVNQKSKKVETVIADSFDEFYGTDNYFENLESKEITLNYLNSCILPYYIELEHYYSRQFEQLQKLLLKTGVNAYFWSHQMWARDMKKFQRILQHTPHIKDGHFSWKGHREFSSTILECIKKKQHIIYRNLI